MSGQAFNKRAYQRDYMPQYYRDKPWMRSTFKTDAALARQAEASATWKAAHPDQVRQYMRAYMRRYRLKRL